MIGFSKCVVLASCIALMTMIATYADRAADQHGAQHMMANGYYFREPVDQDWQLRIVGEIPSLPGCYYILHDTEGGLLLRRQIPHGTYTEQEPFVLDIPKDGRIGDYRLQVLGQQDDLLGPRMPISTLPFEVYGRNYFTAGHNDTPIYFKVPPGVEKRNIRGYTATVRVYQDDQLIADAKEQGKLVGRDWSVDFAVKPDIVYRIERDCFYFRSDDGLLFTFDPDRWFAPDERLDAINWWDLTE